MLFLIGQHTLPYSYLHLAAIRVTHYNMIDVWVAPISQGGPQNVSVLGPQIVKVLEPHGLGNPKMGMRSGGGDFSPELLLKVLGFL